MVKNVSPSLTDKIGLKAKVTVLLLALSLIPLLLVGAVTVNRANSWGKASEESHFLQTSNFMASAYSDLFEGALRDLERLSVRFPAERFDPASVRSELDKGVFTRPSLEFWPDAPFLSTLGPVFSTFFLALPNGDVYFSAPYRNMSSMLRLSQYDWFKQMSTKPILVGTQLEKLSLSNRAVVLVLMPLINRQGKLVGHIGGQIDESRIEEIAARLRAGELAKDAKITMSLATPDGTVLAHTSPELRGERLSDDIVAAGRIGISEVDVDGSSMLVGASSVAQTPWVVRITAPTHHVYKVVHVLQRVLIVVTLLTFLLVIFIADYVARLVLSPIQDLERGARMLESGSLGYRIELRRHTNDELGHLAEAFNQMAQSLQAKDEEIRTYGQNLETANEELDAMIYAVTHDVRTALEEIKSAALGLQERHGDDAVSREKLLRISRRQHQISQLNADLVQLIQTERESVEFRNFPSLRMLEGIRSAIKSRQRGDIYISGQMPTLVGDEKRLSEAFGQVLENGLRFNQHAMPTVEINSRYEGDNCIFEISDNGVGLLTEQFEKAFELFSRLGAEADLEGSGTGLNLARRIITDHGGSIRFTSSRLGEGSTIQVKLPRVTEKGTLTSA